MADWMNFMCSYGLQVKHGIIFTADCCPLSCWGNAFSGVTQTTTIWCLMKPGHPRSVRERRMIHLGNFPFRRHSWIWWVYVCVCCLVFLICVRYSTLCAALFSHLKCFHIWSFLWVFWGGGRRHCLPTSDQWFAIQVKLLYNGRMISCHLQP